MIWDTSETCKVCGAQFEIKVWNLGHKDTDSITCQSCGNILKEWKNEARSYSIEKMVKPGSQINKDKKDNEKNL